MEGRQFNKMEILVAYTFCTKQKFDGFYLFGCKQGVDMFGKRIGFLKFKADIIDKETGKKVSIVSLYLVKSPVL